MTVNELTNELKNFPSDAIVSIEGETESITLDIDDGVLNIESIDLQYHILQKYS